MRVALTYNCNVPLGASGCLWMSLGEYVWTAQLTRSKEVGQRGRAAAATQIRADVKVMYRGTDVIISYLSIYSLPVADANHVGKVDQAAQWIKTALLNKTACSDQEKWNGSVKLAVLLVRSASINGSDP